MTTITNNKLTDETLKAWKTEAKISLGETARDSVDYSHHEAILALVTEIQEHRKAAAEPVLYVMGMGYAFDAETASTCKGAVDSWVGEWNQERLPGQEEYRTVPLYTAPPVQETGVYKDMLNIIGLLENNEWAEHCTSTVLGSHLESEITRLIGKEQPVPVMPPGLHPDTQKLVADFSTDLAEKLYKAQLKYGYDADWKQDNWSAQCLAHFHQHIAKGDPRDVAAYCAFMWYHDWKTEPATAPVVPDERAAFNAWNNEDNLPIAGVGAKNAAWLAWQARASLCGNSALNVPPERPADSSNGDDVEAWFDEGWNACRAAMLQGEKS